ncbi:hypothetical protein ACFL5O_04445, partial [Myxococcota bacterium]
GKGSAETLQPEQNRGRVAPGRCLPRAPTDPDLPNSGIRLIRSQILSRRAPRNRYTAMWLAAF